MPSQRRRQLPLPCRLALREVGQLSEGILPSVDASEPVDRDAEQTSCSIFFDMDTADFTEVFPW